MVIVSAYSGEALAPKSREFIIKDALRKLKKFNREHPFNAIAFQGMSGAVIAPILAHALRKNLLFVRKGDSTEEGIDWKESAHSYLKVEGPDGPVKYIIVDDFIAGGKTIKRCIQEISKRNPLAECVGIYLWRCGSGFHRTIWYLEDLDKHVPLLHTYVDSELLGDKQHYAWISEVKDGMAEGETTGTTEAEGSSASTEGEGQTGLAEGQETGTAKSERDSDTYADIYDNFERILNQLTRNIEDIEVNKVHADEARTSPGE